MRVFVVTNVESGWDCVRGVYYADSEEALAKLLADEEDLSVEEWEETNIIHNELLTDVRT